MYFNCIQVLRAFGAFYVLLYHIIYWWDQKKDAFTGIFDNGYGSIDLFFVISGFVVFQSARNSSSGWRAFLLFCAKRLIRIYPMYWIFALCFLLTGLSQLTDTSTTGLIKSFLLLPRHSLIIITSWTLPYEIYFYLLLGLYVWDRRWKTLLAALLFLSVMAFLTEIRDWRFPIHGFYNEFVFEFFLGTLAIYMYKQIPTTTAWLLSIAGLLLFIFPFHPEVSHVQAFGIPSMLLLLGLTSLEYRHKIVVPGCLVTAGNASYCLYLIHAPLMYYILFTHTPATLATNRLFLLSLAAAIGGLSILIHLYLEKPLLRYLNQQLPGPRLTTPGPLP